jgi:hypothetical protein
MKKDDQPLVDALVDAMDAGSSALAKHALRQCRKVEIQLRVLIGLLEAQLNEEDIEKDGGPS